MLVWRTTEIRATTHRGVYDVHLVQGRASAYFLPYTGGAECVYAPDYSTDPSAVIGACDDHAQQQPAHPAMRGWPADAELEATHG